jgi:hypothetical protein
MILRGTAIPGADGLGVGDQRADVGVAAVGDQDQALALLGSGSAITAWRLSGQTADARSSAAVSETISPPILAKRFTRPVIFTQPSSLIETTSPVSCQPSTAARGRPRRRGSRP